jgi:hypothetical protein
MMTMLRRDPLKSYESQLYDLLVVPRAQFICVEIARFVGGVYGEGWRVNWLKDMGLRMFETVQTSRFTVFEKKFINENINEEKRIKEEAQRIITLNKEKEERVRKGEQLKECTTADEASSRRTVEESVKVKIMNGIRKLKEEKFVVIDDVVPGEKCVEIEENCIKYFEEIGDRRVKSQREYRGDSVVFLNLFGASEIDVDAVKVRRSKIREKK